MEETRTAELAAKEKIIRKCRSSLSISGVSVIALGLWAVIKAVLNYVMNPVNSGSSPESKSSAADAKIIVFGLSLLILAVELGLRVYVGLSAMSESRGKRRPPVYIAFAVLIACFIAYNVLPSIITIFRTRPFFFTSVASLLLDVASLAVLAELVVSAIRLRYYLKKRETDESAFSGVSSGKEAM